MFAYLLLCALTIAQSAPGLAGTLDDFEHDATDDSDDDDGGSDDVYFDDDELDYATAFVLALAVPAYGAIQSWDRVRNDPPKGRSVGEATIAFARVDAAYQLVESDVDAWDLRGEAGYGPFAIQVRETHYDEDRPRDDLDLVQAHAMLRMMFHKSLEIDAGFGGLVIEGDDTSSGFSGTIPVLFHPWDFLGLEFRPAWAAVHDNTVSDYDLSLLAGWRFVSARVGYRWTDSGSSSLNGPIFGLAARW